MNIALIKARETRYWLKIIHGGGLMTGVNTETYFENVDELIKMLTSIVKTTKERMNKS
jgi:four helix bundle protein